MSYYALTDSDWSWDDESEGRAIVIHADTPQDAVRIATEKHIAENPGAAGICWKVARLWNVGFEMVDWEDDNKPNYDGFKFYPEGCNGPMDTPSVQPSLAAHSDDLAVDRFATAMKAKLAKKRDEGRGGWDNPDECSIAFLSKLLREHVAKGDTVDVGNLAMMIHQRGGMIE